jgi:hypothetical protein
MPLGQQEHEQVEVSRDERHFLAVPAERPMRR